MSEAELGEAGPGAAERGGGLLAATVGYCLALLICWLLSAELFRLALGDHPRLVLVAAQVVGIMLPAVALTRLFGQIGYRSRTSRRPPPTGTSLAIALPGLAVGGFLVAIALNFAWIEALKSTDWEWVAEWESFVTESYRELLITESPLELLGVLAMVSLVPAVCEELAFRRGLQGLIASRTSGATAVVVSAAVFSLFHLEPFGLPTRFFLGVTLGIVYHRTGSLWTAGVLHAAHNLVTVAGIQYAEAQRGDAAPALNELAGVPLGPVAAIGAVGLVGWVISLQVLRPTGAGAFDEPEA